MSPEQQERFHQSTLHWIRSRAQTIKRELNEKFDQAVLDLGLGTLRDIGVRNYGAYDRYRFFECIKCGTQYPEKDGKIHCNGRNITKCLCQEPPPLVW